MKKFLLIFSTLAISLLLIFLFNNKKEVQAQQSYCAVGWSGTWEPGRVPMTTNSQYVLTNSPIYVSNNNVGIGTTNPTARLYVKTTDATTIPFQVVAPVSSWRYRKPITINNTQNANNLTDYQVLITLNTASLIFAGKMRIDCEDIRFTDSDGTTLLNYWIEPGCNTSNTRIWVKVPSIPARSTKTIYVYYGNPLATSASSETNTFDYVDRGDQTSSWTLSGYSGQSTGQGNPKPSYYARSKSGFYMYRNINLVPERIITFNVKTNGVGDFYFLVNKAGTGQMYRLDRRKGNGSGFAKTTSWVSWNAPSPGFHAANKTWYKLTIVITSSTSATLYYSQTTDASPSNFGTLLGTYKIKNNGGYIGLVGDDLDSDYNTWWDNIIVRKYASPEPITSVGKEEPLSQQQTVFYIQNQTGNAIFLSNAIFSNNAIFSGNIGIGTTRPEYKLEVLGSVRTTGGVAVYKITNNYCNTGLLSSNPTCDTQVCNAGYFSSDLSSGYFSYYYTCNGVCNRYSPDQCPNTLVGRLWSP